MEGIEGRVADTRDQVRLGRPKPTNMTRKLITIASALFGFSKTVVCTFSRSIK
jgi:hypothetical protein